MSSPPPKRVLVLGGSSEASALVAALSGDERVDVVLSLAGRTSAPIVQPVATRIGGFGGVDGLAAYLAVEAIDILVDATHPFAAQMSHHARIASERAGCKLIVVRRPDWQPRPGDDWTQVSDMAEAAVRLGAAPRRVFLTVGRLQLAAFRRAPQHAYLVRTIEPIDPAEAPPTVTAILARGPFPADDEERLMRDHGIDVLVTKQSGGTATAGKLEAARRLGLPVILVRRPAARDENDSVDVDEALAIIAAHRAAERGV